MTSRLLVPVAILIGVILLAGCGNDRTARAAAARPATAATTTTPSVDRPPGGTADEVLAAAAPRDPTSYRPAPRMILALPATATSAPEPTDDDLASPSAREIAVCRRFLAWAERYRAADYAGRAALAAEGLDLAGERRSALAALVRSDPRRALALKLPLRERAVMPPAIFTQLEQRLAGNGRFAAIARVRAQVARPTSDQRAVVPMLLVGDQQFERSSYGRRATLITTSTVPVHGIILDGVAAVHEDAVRPLEPDEVMDPSIAPVNPDLGCPVSGEPSDVVADLGGRPIYLCSGGHIRALNEQFADHEATLSAKAATTLASSPWTEGTKTVLYIRVRFSDQSDSVAPSEATCQNTIAQMSAFLNQNSYGRLISFTATVTPILALGNTAASYASTPNDDMMVRSDALAAAEAAGFNPTTYNFDIVRYSGTSAWFAGQAYVNERGVWLKTDSVAVAAHEFGHNLGLWHANFWNTSNGSPIGPGTNVAYGNDFDTMGDGNAGAAHFNAGSKLRLGWLPTVNIHQPNVNGTFRLFPQDHAILLPSSQKQALILGKETNRDYIVEFRQRFTSSLWQMHGVTVKWNGPNSSNGEDLLLDSTPGSPDGKDDAAVVIGQTFSDRAAGIHITPIALGGTTPQSIDVVINRGTFLGNANPSVAASGPTSTAINTAIGLSATASDPDAGDVLAYAWDFGDRTVSTTNNASVSKQWSTAGSYVVRCTVSDMRGGVASDSLLVTVGSPTVFAIRGRVLDGAAGVHGVRIHNGQSGSAYRGTFTESDGTYILGNLATGSVTVSAISPLHTLTTSFTNPVTIGPDASNKDFIATRRDEISITTIDAIAAETGSDTATFRISQATAGATARTVGLVLSGSAVRPGATAADYTLAGGAITLSGATATVTIPAGLTSVDVVLTAITDSTAEGAETATLLLSENSAYALLAPITATATITGASGPANDAFANRITLSGATTTVTGTSQFASRESGEPAHAGGNGTASVWWTWTAPVNGVCTVNLSGSGFDTVLAIYTGSTVSGLTTIGWDDDGGTAPDSKLVFTVSAGTVYQIAVDGFSSGNQGAIALAITLAGTPTATIAASDATATEGADTGTFTVSLSPTSTSSTTIAYTVAGSATAGDFTALTGSLVIPANTATATITVTATSDATSEPAETVIVTLASGTGYVVGSPAAATVTISDPPPPTASITATDAIASEAGPTTATYTVTLSSPAPSTLSLPFTIAGTALAGDHLALTSPLIITAGTSSGTLTLTPVDDSAIEGSETVVVTLTAGSGYSLGTPATATVTITDNDAPIATIVATAATASETGPTAGAFTVTLSSPTTAAITVALTLSGTASAGDYQSVTAAVAIAAGGSSGVLTINPMDDTIDEADETLIATIAAGVGYSEGAPMVATVTIIDNDPPASGGGTIAASGGGGGGGGCGMGSTVAMLGLALAATLWRSTGRRRR